LRAILGDFPDTKHRELPGAYGDLPVTEKGRRADKELLKVKEFLKMLEWPKDLDRKTLAHFLKKLLKFFVCSNRLWRHKKSNHHQIVLFVPDHLEVIVKAHNHAGHRGIYAT
jgi:hypothetical protein